MGARTQQINVHSAKLTILVMQSLKDEVLGNTDFEKFKTF